MGFTSSLELYNFASDFAERPEALSTVLRDDFGLKPPLKSHQIRAALMRLVKTWPLSTTESKEKTKKTKKTIEAIMSNNSSDDDNDRKIKNDSRKVVSKPKEEDDDKEKEEEEDLQQPLFRSVIINQKQKNRLNQSYGLPSNYQSSFPRLAKELEDFMTFMTIPSANGRQESPIRKQTAVVYLRHAKLFLGWYQEQQQLTTVTKENLSLYEIIPNKEATSTQCIIDFILWLRKNRSISDSYEASILRGLTKLIKFRFSKESTTDAKYHAKGKSFNDIPAVSELRKLHRDAGRRQQLSPRSSDEDKKWLEWEEYLNVVQALKKDVEKEIAVFKPKDHPPVILDNNKKTKYSSIQRRIAIKFRNYLILAFFSCVPDRQRTFRELKLEKNFLYNDDMNSWIIKHGPDDYKTGSTYGDRPPLVIAPELTPAINDYLDRWRPCLLPTGSHVFVQSRTGNELTRDSLYSIVSRECYKHGGKRTNPHLLRDMIVTHVRKSNASEKELEALALYMGHSISMQRSSYDRRTMVQKVAPAVELLRTVNRGGDNDS